MTYNKGMTLEGFCHAFTCTRPPCPLKVTSIIIALCLIHAT